MVNHPQPKRRVLPQQKSKVISAVTKVPSPLNPKENRREEKRKKEQEETLIVIDSGAGIHITHDKSLLVDYEGFEEPKTCYYGVGDMEKQDPIKLIGQGYLPFRITKKKTVGILAMYCPGEDRTILSAVKLNTDLKVKIHENLDYLLLKDRKVPLIKKDGVLYASMQELIANTLLSNGKHRKIHLIKEDNKGGEMALYEAHRRLNHLNKQAIIDTVNNNIFRDVQIISDQSNQKNFWCEVCSSGKATRHPHYQGSMNAYAERLRPGVSWSVDTFGPINRLPVGVDRYMLLMVDNASRYLIVSTHTTKNEDTISAQMKENIRFIETQFEVKVKEIISDQGTEFDNKSIRTLYKEFGIRPIFTATQDHAANARAERNIRTIKNDIVTLLTQSGLGLKYWTYAAMAAADIRNKTYNKQIKTAPLLKLSPDPMIINLKSFVPFGAKVMVWQPTETKLTPPGLRGTVLCRDPNSTGYFVLIHKGKKIVSTTNFQVPKVLYDESAIDEKLGKVDNEYDKDDIIEGLGLNEEIEEETDIASSTDTDTNDGIDSYADAGETSEGSHEEIVEQLLEESSDEEEKFEDLMLQESFPVNEDSDVGGELPNLIEAENSNGEESDTETSEENENEDNTEIFSEEETTPLTNVQELPDDSENDNEPRIDPNDIEETDITPLLGRQVEPTSTNKRSLSDSEEETEDEEVYEIPRELREDIVGKDNTTTLREGESIASRTRHNKKARLAHIKETIYHIKFKPPVDDWERKFKLGAIYYNEAITNNPNPEEKRKFKEAYDKEYNNLISMEVIDPNVKLLRGTVPKNQIISTTPIFTIKRSGEHKARIVARGDRQDETTYGDTKTSNLTMDSLKMLLIHANNNKWYMKSVDINFAFLHAPLDTTLYIPHPLDHQYVTPLKKSLYGLKQSPKLWNDMFRKSMNKLGYHDTPYTPGLYVSEDGQAMIGTYVDDCLIVAPTQKKLQEISEKIEKEFSVKTVASMSKNKFDADVLGLDLHYDRKRGIVTLCPTTYIENIIDTIYKDVVEGSSRKVTMPHSSTYEINPKIDKLKLTETALKQGIKDLQEKIGRLNYIRTHGRADIEFAVAKIARYVLYPHKKIVNAVNRIIRYLHYTKDIGLRFVREQDPDTVTLITDSSHGSEYDYLSRHGILVFFGRNLMSYTSKKSNTVLMSSSAAELDALYVGEQIGELVKQKWQDLLGKEIKLKSYVDSEPVISWMKQDYYDPKRFIGIRVEYMKQQVRGKHLELEWIDGKKNPANILTKPVPHDEFTRIVTLMKEGLQLEE